MIDKAYAKEMTTEGYIAISSFIISYHKMRKELQEREYQAIVKNCTDKAGCMDKNTIARKYSNARKSGFWGGQDQTQSFISSLNI